jgi:hypothetical protein
MVAFMRVGPRHPLCTADARRVREFRRAAQLLSRRRPHPALTFDGRVTYKSGFSVVIAGEIDEVFVRRVGE